MDIHDIYEEKILAVLHKTIRSWTYEEYMEWLEMPYVTIEDLQCAKRAFERLDMPRDYIKIIDIQIKKLKL